MNDYAWLREKNTAIQAMIDYRSMLRIRICGWIVASLFCATSMLFLDWWVALVFAGTGLAICLIMWFIYVDGIDCINMRIEILQKNAK